MSEPEIYEDPFSPFGTDLFGNPIVPDGRGPLAERFEFAPLSVLNAREGEWQARKEAWMALGIKSEVGRDKNLLKFSDTILREQGGSQEGTSVFDPVLCELAYKWFCPDGGLILDPFAGGSVRGIVAAQLGYRYHGIELRPEQVTANWAQKEAICPRGSIFWACGDSREMLEQAPAADFIFTCPPYGDLERYSDDPKDLSTMDYQAFMEALRKIIVAAVSKLRQDRLACFVIGDFRDKKTGMYRGFVADTISIFRAAGLPLYNDAILVTSVGSLPIRISGQFEKGRKLGKTHQNVLVFAKGDPRRAFARR